MSPSLRRRSPLSPSHRRRLQTLHDLQLWPEEVCWFVFWLVYCQHLTQQLCSQDVIPSTWRCNAPTTCSFFFFRSLKFTYFASLLRILTFSSGQTNQEANNCAEGHICNDKDTINVTWKIPFWKIQLGLVQNNNKKTISGCLMWSGLDDDDDDDSDHHHHHQRSSVSLVNSSSIPPRRER